MFIGIDPGLKGGIAIIDFEGNLVNMFKMPDAYILADLLDAAMVPENRAKSLCTLEQVNPMPGEGVRSVSTFARGVGTIEGILIGLKIPYQLVRPFNWQRTMHRGIDRKSYDKPKVRSLRAARQLYPDQTFILEKCRVAHDGIVDAVLLATYGRWENLGLGLEQLDSKCRGNPKNSTP